MRILTMIKPDLLSTRALQSVIGLTPASLVHGHPSKRLAALAAVCTATPPRSGGVRRSSQAGP
jgi:hypothetical protein